MMPGQAWDGLAGWGDGAWVRVAHFFVVAVMGNQPRGYGATAARLTPDQKVGSWNLSGLTLHAAWVPGAHRKKRCRGTVLRQ